MGLLHQSLHQRRMRFLQCLLHEGRHEYVAFHVDVFAQPQAMLWDTQSYLHRFDGFVRQRSAHCPFALDVQPHGRITVGLQPIAEIVETGAIGDFARVHTAGQILDFVGHGVPNAMKFLGGSLCRRFDRMTFFDQRVQIDHLDMIMETLQNNLSCYSGRKASKRGEYGSFRHN